MAWEMVGGETIMQTVQVQQILLKMQPHLDGHQMRILKEVLVISGDEGKSREMDDGSLMTEFLQAKRTEGCSERTIAYYEATITAMAASVNMPISAVTTTELRRYLLDFENTHHVSKVTIDNIRRILSSFFSWLEDEDYIVKSPMRKIKRIKVPLVVKETIADKDMELLREGCRSMRDLAIVDLLASTGMRVGELVRLDVSDVDLPGRECIVTGKGNKQRRVYFDARTELHLQEYLSGSRFTTTPLFTSDRNGGARLTIGSVERIVRNLGRRNEMRGIHPHKFRRTMATNAIDRGMPIEQVQVLLGHAKIETTMRYALVSRQNVKTSHRRYLG